MGNMSYCRFENTYQDLKECYDVLTEQSIEETEADAGKYEKPYIKKLVKLCGEIWKDYKDEL